MNDVTEDLKDLAAWLDQDHVDLAHANWFQQGALWEMARVSGEPFAGLQERLSAFRVARVAPSMPPLRPPFAQGGVVRNPGPTIVGEGFTPAPGVGIRMLRPDLLGSDDAPPQFAPVSDEERQRVRDIAMGAQRDQAMAEHPVGRQWAEVPGVTTFTVIREAQEPTPIDPDEPCAPPDPWSMGELARSQPAIIAPVTPDELAELEAEASDEDDAAVARAVAAVKARTEAMKG